MLKFENKQCSRDAEFPNLWPGGEGLGTLKHLGSSYDGCSWLASGYTVDLQKAFILWRAWLNDWKTQMVSFQIFELLQREKA